MRPSLNVTTWQLADGTSVEILNLLDDHSRLLLACTAFPIVKAADVVRTFFSASDAYGLPATAFAARVKAGPAADKASVQYRVGHDRIDSHGTVTLRYLSRLRHIRVGAAHAHRVVRLLLAGPYVRVVGEDGSAPPRTDHRPPSRLPAPQRPLARPQCLATGVSES